MAQYTNPNQQGGGGMDSSKLLVYVVIFLVFFLGMKYFMPQKPAPAPQTASQSAPAAAPAAPAPAPAASAAHASSAPAITAKADTETVVESELYRITFTNRGARVTSWILKKEKDTSGKPLDLVHPKAASQFGYPLSLYSTDGNTLNVLLNGLYVPSASGTLTAPATLSFDYADGNGLVVHKSFRFDESYVIHAETQVTFNGAPVRSWLIWPTAFGDQQLGGDFANSQIDTMQNGKENHLATKKTNNNGILDGPFDWAGVSDQHFAAIFLPDAAQNVSLVTFNHGLQVPDSKGDLPALGAGLAADNGHTLTRLYVGPKLFDVLKSVHATGSNGAADGPSLEKLIDFGFFGPIAKFLFLALFFVYQHLTGNWGWAIIVLTVIINVILMPVRVITMKSALKMQRIQPQMDQIKAKYAKFKVTDPKRQDMNAEIMKLQKDNGVNMFGGCIPSLLQLPLLFAFFTMLRSVTELRLQHWYWLPDLTAKDPYHILPILMVVTSFLVQFYTPSPGVDPQQQKMMAFVMPAFSGWMVWNFASGLGLYWATGNVIMIAQQLVMNQTSMGREMKEIAAKRARRKAGLSANTIQGKR
ncbi:MAG: membrane protein insertase YidC [Acidobacteriaceae bacterium]|nr:membrane protein insertase YidC [Acidobacteriaceae bacterium]